MLRDLGMTKGDTWYCIFMVTSLFARNDHVQYPPLEDGE